jgi:hypothetical protein
MKFFKVFTSVVTGLTLAAGSGAVYAQQPGTGANTTAAPVNFLSFRSQSGKPNWLTENRTHLYYTKDLKNSDIKVSQFNRNNIHKGFRISVLSGSDRWNLEVHAPLNSTDFIRIGKYDRAERAGFAQTVPGLDLSGAGRGCNKVSGSFDVREMKLSGTGTVEKLAIDFVHKCEQRDENTVIGAVRFHSSVPVPPGFPQPPVVQPASPLVVKNYLEYGSLLSNNGATTSERTNLDYTFEKDRLPNLIPVKQSTFRIWKSTPQGLELNFGFDPKGVDYKKGRYFVRSNVPSASANAPTGGSEHPRGVVNISGSLLSAPVRKLPASSGSARECVNGGGILDINDIAYLRDVGVNRSTTKYITKLDANLIMECPEFKGQPKVRIETHIKFGPQN